MNIQCPLHLIPKVFLADAPSSEYQSVDSDGGSSAASLTAKKSRSMIKLLSSKPSKKSSKVFDKSPEFNVAGWLFFDVPPPRPVSLLLVWESGGVESAVIVDECHVDKSGQAMLSGKVSLSIKEPIDSLAVYCGGVSSKIGLRVDELYVQKVNKGTAVSKSTSIQ